jgi:ketosteroid isomerase-like protein
VSEYVFLGMRYFILLVLVATYSCKSDTDLVEKSKQEIIETENAFSKMAGEAGIEKAFLEFADELAVLNRNNSIIKGHKSILEHFSKIENTDSKLEWKPDFVDVSSSGDLGYTYGKYTYYSTDRAGNTSETKGIFHTVWKKQKDGTWKYVWD